MCVVHQNDQEEDEKTYNTTTLATFESLTIPLVQEVVVLADFQCKRCQDRVAEILSRFNGEAESVEFSFMEKKVTLTLNRRNQRATKMPVINQLQNNATKISSLKRMFSSSSKLISSLHGFF